MPSTNKPARGRRILKVFFAGMAAITSVLVISAILIANSQDGTVKFLQRYLYSSVWKYPPNSFESRSAPQDEIRDGSLRVRTNIRYGDRYPNSYFDLWQPNESRGEKQPTVIYIHGGGWFMGDKDSGDPMAGGTAREPLELARQGLNVVNLNYALAPEYRYPVQMHQLNDAIRHLTVNADQYQIDMSRVVVMGGSAGAHMTAQYGLLVSDPAYATDVGIDPAIDTDRLKALVIFSAPLRFSGLGWRASTMLWSYLGTKDLDSSTQARQTDILSQVGPHYPPTYITDGNQPDTFPEHAKKMVSLLKKYNVDHVFNYYEPEEALLDHSYTGRLDTKHGRDNIEKTIAFIHERTGRDSTSESWTKSEHSH